MALGILKEQDIQEHDPQIPVAVLEVKLPPPLPLVQAVVQQLAKNLAVRVCQEMGKEAVQEFAALHSEEGGGGEVGLQDLAGCVQGEVAHRRKVIEVGVFAAGLLQPGLGQPELLVLHLQLDLVHPEFVDEAGGLGRGELLGGYGLGREQRLGPPAQVAKVGGAVFGVCHGSVLLMWERWWKARNVGMAIRHGLPKQWLRPSCHSYVFDSSTSQLCGFYQD